MKFRITLVLLALVMPTVSNALSLGQLELQSGLNQPFKARVKLLSATADELDSLKISLADQEAFDRAGIQRTFLLSRLRFTVQEFENDPDYIQIRSNESIREPFLNFLLEINWSEGRLYREYTVLLDPPTYTASSNKRQAVVHPQTPVVEKDTGDNQVVYDLEYKADKPRVSVPARSTPSYETPRAINYSGSGGYGPAVTGDTLWSIAKATRTDSSVSIQQTMLAILSANPEAFIENNINGLKRGAVLQIPDESEVSPLAQADALAQVSNQHALWDEYKGHVASSVPARAQGAGVSSLETGAVDVERESTVIDAEEAGEAKLRLISESDQGSGSDQSSAESSSVDIDSLNNDLVLANESIEALSMENAELKDKLTETEGIIDDLKRLIVLKEDELVAMQEQIMLAAVEQDSADEIATETDAEKADEKVTEDETDVSDSEEVILEDVDVATSDSALSGFMGLLGKAKDYLMIIGGVVGGLILLVLAMLFASKRRSAKATVIDLPAEDFSDFSDEDSAKAVLMSDGLAGDDSESITVIPGSEDETISPGDDAFDIPDIPEESSPVSVAEPEEDDPMEEVNVFLAYEHFDEAESFVRGALEKEPDNLDFHGKLLEVFYAAGNKKSYEAAARAVHEKTGGQGTHWDMVIVMWKEMSPNSALFDAPEAGEDEKASTDIPSEGVLNITASDDGSGTNDMDFDIGGEDSAEDMLDVTAAADMNSISAAADGDNDLDISFGGPSSEEDVLDVSMAAESDDANELDISFGDASDDDSSLLDQPSESKATDTTEASEGLLDVTTSVISFESEGGEDLLDVTAAISADDLVEPGASQEESDGMDIDLSISEDSSDIGLVDDLSGSVGNGTDGGPSSEEDVLDVSMAAESDDANELDISFGDASDDDSSLLDQPSESKATDTTEASEGLLDVTTSVISFESEGGEDLLDVTAAISADDLVEPGASQEESDGMDIDLSISEDSSDIGLVDDLSGSVGNGTDSLMDDVSMDVGDSTGGESDGLDFDLGIDDDTNESVGLALDDSKGDNDFELTISDIGVESDADIDAHMESTIQMPASVDSLIMAEEDDSDDKAYFVAKTANVDEQSGDEEMASQLDLAKAYIELGDTDNAKTILDEIIAQGSDDYRKQAEELIGQID